SVRPSLVRDLVTIARPDRFPCHADRTARPARALRGDVSAERRQELDATVGMYRDPRTIWRPRRRGRINGDEPRLRAVEVADIDKAATLSSHREGEPLGVPRPRR